MTALTPEERAAIRDLAEYVDSPAFQGDVSIGVIAQNVLWLLAALDDAETRAATVAAERDRLRAVVERVETLADKYDAWTGERDSPWQNSPLKREQLRAALDGKG